MSNTAQNFLTPSDVIRILQDRPRRWIIPAVALTLLAVVFAFVKSSTWEASQALIIREEARTEKSRPGSFADVSEMKTVQETILELVRSKSILRDALVAIGPGEGKTAGPNWPSDRDIADLRERVKLTPPNGAEFGKTEVFYLKVKDSNRPRAVAMADEICNQLQHGFQALRDAKLESLTEELARAVNMAEQDLGAATKQLAELESRVGVDLSELRMLHIGTTSGSDLRQKLVEVQNEIRNFEAEKNRNEQLLVVLKAAQHDPGRLLATPNTLLNALPSVKRLKDGLVDAQLETSKLIGTMSVSHPLVQSAQAAEAEISQNLHSEMALAIKGLEVELSLTNARVSNLKSQLTGDEGRLQRLASLRAEYANLVAMTENRTTLLETARRNLADARAGRASVNNVSLISRIDTPDTGINPIGPSKASIGAAGLLGGLMLGFGFVFLTTGPVTPAPASEIATAVAESYYPAVEETIISSPEAIEETVPAAQDGLSFTGALKKLSRQHFSVVSETA